MAGNSSNAAFSSPNSILNNLQNLSLGTPSSTPLPPSMNRVDYGFSAAQATLAGARVNGFQDSAEQGVLGPFPGGGPRCPSGNSDSCLCDSCLGQLGIIPPPPNPASSAHHSPINSGSPGIDSGFHQNSPSAERSSFASSGPRQNSFTEEFLISPFSIRQVLLERALRGSLVSTSRGFRNLGAEDLYVLHRFEELGLNRVATDRDGSRMLQRYLDSGDSRAMEKIFRGLLGTFHEIMMNQFGADCFQTLLQVCRFEQLKKIVRELVSRIDDLLRVGIDDHGSRALQALVVKLKKEKKSLLQELIHALRDRCLLPLRTDQTHYDVPPASLLRPLGSHAKGCLILNDCVKHSARDANRELLMKQLAEDSLFLAEHPFGNYVVQQLIAEEVPEISSIICEKLRDSYQRLAMDKFGSHVLEKMMRSRSMKRETVLQLVSCNALDHISGDQFGNFTVQTAWKVTKDHDDLRSELIRALDPFIRNLRHHPFGKNVYDLVKGKSSRED